jgi:arginine decarboxylase
VKPEALKRWTADDSAELYGIRNWGHGYFDIAENGRVIVRPWGPEGKTTVDLLAVVNDLKQRNISMPVLLRFADILACQIRLVNKSFAEAIQQAGYQGTYRCVYPIKVNQKQQVVSDIMKFGRDFHHGIEAGSKAELIAAIANMRDPEALVVCNGYKDEEFIDLALYSLKMGLQTCIVLEMPNEVDLILERAKKLGIRPRLGVRAKLFSRAGGHWDGSGGDRSKFGMDASQIIDVVDTLRKAGMLDCLQMLHYHLGSQIPDIRRIRTALQEACRFYVELAREGAAMGILNVGGGLAIDYDGSHTNFASSTNYTIAEYAADVVEAVMNITNEAGIPHPMIVSESGRAIVSHHSVLLFDILDVRRFTPPDVPEKLPDESNEMLRNLMEVRTSLTPRNVQEAYHDAIFYRDQLRSLFLQGMITLRERALAENIFWNIIRTIADDVQNRKYVPDEMEGLESAIADVYYGNFSLFQSLPDSWAIDQLFPVMPIHRLNEMPARQAVVADITCDSDGKIDSFIDLRDVKHVLPLHEPNGEEYYVGAFLVGAYQETLGDMHNLLGDINVLHIRVTDDSKIEYTRVTPGDSVREVLSYVEYDPSELLRRIYRTTEGAAKGARITEDERQVINDAFSEGMRGYTYFER